jgi:hypothetical protein
MKILRFGMTFVDVTLSTQREQALMRISANRGFRVILVKHVPDRGDCVAA